MARRVERERENGAKGRIWYDDADAEFVSD